MLDDPQGRLLQLAHPMRLQRSRGFTLIELMVAISIFAILTMLAVPLYSQFIANTQIRSATESIVNGVRSAQTEAVKRNGQVEFRLDPAVGYAIYLVEEPDPALRTLNVLEASPKVAITADGGLDRVTFNGLGRVLGANPLDGTAPLQQIDVTTTMTNVDSTDLRPLRVVIGSAFGVKACDPKLKPGDPAACP